MNTFCSSKSKESTTVRWIARSLANDFSLEVDEDLSPIYSAQKPKRLLVASLY